jgi:hypothetical protein
VTDGVVAVGGGHVHRPRGSGEAEAAVLRVPRALHARSTPREAPAHLRAGGLPG